MNNPVVSNLFSILQEEDIMRIADTAVHTTENIKDANEEIREVKLIL